MCTHTPGTCWILIVTMRSKTTSTLGTCQQVRLLGGSLASTSTTGSPASHLCPSICRAVIKSSSRKVANNLLWMQLCQCWTATLLDLRTPSLMTSSTVSNTSSTWWATPYLRRPMLHGGIRCLTTRCTCTCTED